jgi:hypothetical protein
MLEDGLAVNRVDRGGRDRTAVRVAHNIDVLERRNIEVDDLRVNLKRPPAEPENKRASIAQFKDAEFRSAACVCPVIISSFGEHGGATSRAASPLPSLARGASTAGPASATLMPFPRCLLVPMSRGVTAGGNGEGDDRVARERTAHLGPSRAGGCPGCADGLEREASFGGGGGARKSRVHGDASPVAEAPAGKIRLPAQSSARIHRW